LLRELGAAADAAKAIKGKKKSKAQLVDSSNDEEYHVNSNLSVSEKKRKSLTFGR